MQYILASACLVQVGTASFVDPDAAIRVHEGIGGYLGEQGVATLGELVGALEDGEYPDRMPEVTNDGV